MAKEPSIFNRRLAQRRTALGLQQQELAERMGIPPSQVSKYEHTVVPGRERIEALARVLGCSPAYLSGYSDALDGGDEDQSRPLEGRELEGWIRSQVAGHPYPEPWEAFLRAYGNAFRRLSPPYLKDVIRGLRYPDTVQDEDGRAICPRPTVETYHGLLVTLQIEHSRSAK